VISDAGLTRGKRVTGWLAIRRDLENAGATFVDEAAVTDGNWSPLGDRSIVQLLFTPSTT
jgi:putative intracellular protease/amidase